jgi:hypothetical protein
LTCLLSGVACLTAAVWLALGSWKPTPPALPPEELVVTPAVHDFGAVGPSEVVSAEFTLRNNHRQSISIIELGRSCSCVHLAAAGKEVAPGESTTLQVSWRTHGKRGKVSDTLSVHYLTGSEFRVQPFRLFADVSPDVTAVPETIVFDGHIRGEVRVTIRPRLPATVARILTAHASAEAVTADLSEDGASVLVRYDPNGRVPAGVEHRVLLKLSGVESMWLEIPVVIRQNPNRP